MISKELLNKITECKVLEIHGVFDNELQAELKHQDTTYTINIYELAHKCKEYLLDEGYYIVIHPFKVELFEKDTNSFIRDFHYHIQDKAIPYDIKREIQASQWILDNKKEEN